MRNPLLLLALAGSASASGVVTDTSGSFVATGSMVAPRTGHTATLLPNGTVLIAGGETISFGLQETVLSSAEIYDPRRNTFGLTGQMTVPRFLHTATLLPNGKVLIAGGTSGGFDAFNGLDSAELYDPATGRFTRTGHMIFARAWHTASLLADGRVLIAGGLATNLGSFKTIAELYDADTGTFTTTGALTAPRFAHTATVLASGKVLLDGTHPDAPPIDHADLYDPVTGKFAFTGATSPANYPMTAETATLLPNGSVMVTRSAEGSSSALRYDPSFGGYTPIGNLDESARNQHTATLLPSGAVLIDGGDRSGQALLFNSTSGVFSTTGDPQGIFRRGHTATLLNDGEVLIAGGYDTPPVSLKSAELYQTAVSAPELALLSAAGDGRGQGAILHAGTSQLASVGNPAAAGDILEIYCTGLIEGSVIPPRVAIGGRMAKILYFGKAPGVSGVNQVNVVMPAGVTAGVAVPVQLTYLDRLSNEVNIAVR